MWSRNHTEIVGRSDTVQSIRRAMRMLGPIEDHVLPTVLESRAIGPVVRAGFWAAASWPKRRPLSLQAVLFADPARNRRLADELVRSNPDVVYLDGVRTFPLFLTLQERRQLRRLVVDLDDLMSRRMSEYRESGMVPLGYVGKKLPRWASGLVNLQFFGRAVLGYERGMLERVERLMTLGAEGVVLVSSVEAALLRGRLPAEMGGKVQVIPPCVDIVRPVERAEGPPTFVFIGSDEQAHNRLTIAYLLSMWESCRPAACLKIAGPMVRKWPTVENVVFTGWVKNPSDLYAPGSVMIAPAFIRGGIKTKVLHAFAHGIPAVGNTATFEALPLPGYPFSFEGDEPLREFLAHLPRYADTLHEAALLGQRCLREHFSREGFERAWQRVLSGEPSRRDASPATPSPESSSSSTSRT